jgi:uncharacterized SAM-binding protein YcdF (DUF218 family)
MKQRSVRRLTGWLALLSLAICLAAPVLFFLGRLSEERYKLAFLLASIAWFILATGRGMTGKDPSAG